MDVVASFLLFKEIFQILFISTDMANNIIENARNYIQFFFSDDTSGHDYYHSLRVFKLSSEIANSEGKEINLQVVQLAALLHDVDDYKIKKENKIISNAEKFLVTQDISISDSKYILNIINELSYKAKDSIIPSTLEGKVVQDADRLDAIGAIGVARVFAYGGTINRKIYDPNIDPRISMNFKDYITYKGTSINHFYEKLLLIKDKMNTKRGKEIAKERHAFLEYFLNEFLKEWECTF